MYTQIKRIFSFFLTISMTLSLIACSPTQSSSDNTVKENNTVQNAVEAKVAKKKVVSTTSFINDMVKIIAGDKVERLMIIPAGSDPHIYEPTPQDKEKLESGDLVLYHGLHFEGKMVEILEHLGKNLSVNFPKEKIGIFEQNGETVADPHFWFDIDLYTLAFKEASKQLIELLPEYKDEFQVNTDKYVEALKALDQENRDALNQIPEKSRKLITPHDAFNYFSRRYNFEVKAPQGVSTETEASLQGVEETVDFIVQNKIKAIFAESTTNAENMRALQEKCKEKNWDVKVVSGVGNELFSDSLAPEGSFGDNYLDMYRHNIKLIVDNLK